MQHAWKKADGKREQQSSQDEHHGGISSSFFESWLDSIEEKAQMKPDIPSAFSVRAEPKNLATTTGHVGALSTQHYVTALYEAMTKSKIDTQTAI